MLQKAYFLAKIGADTAENEQHFAEFLPTDASMWPPAGPSRRGAARAEPPAPRLPRGEDAPRDVGRLGSK